ncbi:restriction endonuclease [Micromonospora sp. NPDC048909]|uniref:restriction endonuclease n=1 Tax=Micromonospora sp. NPDC048909 TaxID=3155643 RepID=UPI003401BAD5
MGSVVVESVTLLVCCQSGSSRSLWCGPLAAFTVIPEEEPLTEPLPQTIDSWQKAELNAAEWMRFWGFGDARVTEGGADSGVDVWSRGALAQVKFEAVQVGRPVLQRLVGARGRSVEKALFVFSGAGFSSPAVEYANDMDICLFKYTLAGAMTPENGIARDFLRRFDAERLAAERARTAAWRGAECGDSAERALVVAQLATALRAVEAKRVASGEAEKKPDSPGQGLLGCGVVLLLTWVCLAVKLGSLGNKIVMAVWIGVSIALIVSGIVASSSGATDEESSKEAANASPAVDKSRQRAGSEPS